MRPFRWYRYRAVIVGQESGNRTVVDFVRFRRELDAIFWCAKMDALHAELNALTRWEYEEIP